MPAKKNPLNLNPLQLKTLTLLQELARSLNHAQQGEEPGTVLVTNLPRPHGDHFHVGAAVVRSSDATGLFNPSVYGALTRKGLVAPGPRRMPILTAAGLAYDTGLADRVLHRPEH